MLKESEKKADFDNNKVPLFQ